MQAGRHDPQRHHAGTPHDRVGLLRAFDDLNRQHRPTRHHGRHGRLHPAGPGHPDLVPARGRARPVEGGPDAWWPATASTIRRFERDGAPRMVRNFCIARRLVEAGARVVTLNFSRWDWHGADGKNFVQGRSNMPLLDQAVSALVDRPARARPGSGRVGGGLGRVRPDAAHQQRRRPRSLAAGQLRPAGRRRHEDRARSSAPPIASASTRRAAGASSRKCSRRSYRNIGLESEPGAHLRPQRPAAVSRSMPASSRCAR